MSIKKSVKMIFIYSLLLFACSIFSLTVNAKTIKKSKTLTLGKTYKIAIRSGSKKVKWKVVSGKKVITLKKKRKNSVIVHPNKEGTAKLQGVYGSRKYIYRLEVDTPTEPTLEPKSILPGFDTGETVWNFSISPWKKCLVSSDIILYHMYRLDSAGNILNSVNAYPVSCDLKSFSSYRYINGDVYIKPLSKNLTFKEYDIISTDDSFKDYYTIKIIKDNCIFFFKYSDYDGFVLTGIKPVN